MTNAHTDICRTSSSEEYQHHQHPHQHHHRHEHSHSHPDTEHIVSREDMDDTQSLLLSRTRSQEFSVAESIAVQESLPPEAHKSARGGGDGGNGQAEGAEVAWPRSVRYMILLCAFLTSLSFGVTQVPLLYVFRLMTCDAYYQDHEDPSQGVAAAFSGSTSSILSYALAPAMQMMTSGSTWSIDVDKCSIRPIESATALSVSLLGASTTVFGLLNLFLTGSLIKRIGVKPTLLIQVFFPAVRLVVQNVGVEVWGSAGIVIIQCSQIVSIVGGPSGYLLVLNTFITEVVEHEGRTAALGRLTGSMMFGSALGFLLGGIVAEVFGIKAPFRLTLMLFLISCAFVFVFLPHIPPAAVAEAKAGDTDTDSMDSKRKKKRQSKKPNRFVTMFFGPMAVFAPRKFIGRDGVVRTEYGAFLLAWGVFLGILATGYLPTLLQLYSTNVFRFGTRENGWLIFMYSMLRGAFLTFAFPKLISHGRKVTIDKQKSRFQGRSGGDAESPSEREPLLSSSSQPKGQQAEGGLDGNNEDKGPPKKGEEQTFEFDLTYTRFSLVADGLLTLLCSFVREGWQMYLVAAVLPFAAGTGSSSKGTILQMVGSSASSSERTDALAGVSLVENMARLSTTFVFGVVFASFASIGRTELVFTCNAAVALIGFGVLLFARFPLEGSRPLTAEEEEDEDDPDEDDGEDEDDDDHE